MILRSIVMTITLLLFAYALVWARWVEVLTQ